VHNDDVSVVKNDAHQMNDVHNDDVSVVKNDAHQMNDVHNDDVSVVKNDALQMNDVHNDDVNICISIGISVCFLLIKVPHFYWFVDHQFLGQSSCFIAVIKYWYEFGCI